MAFKRKRWSGYSPAYQKKLDYTPEFNLPTEGEIPSTDQYVFREPGEGPGTPDLGYDKYTRGKKSDAEKIKDEILKLKKPTKTQKDILKRITGDSRGKKTDVTYGTERHAKWEAMAAEMIDQRGKWKEWEIPGISANTQSMNKWLNQYVKGLDKELQEEAKGVIRLTQVHADLQRKLSSVFNNTDFKKWIVYEASTGYYKFEGRASDGDENWMFFDLPTPGQSNI